MTFGLLTPGPLTLRPARRTRFAARSRRAAAALAATLAIAACERPGAADRRSVVEQAVALAPEIERATGLRFTAPPKVEVRTREQVRAFVTRVLDEPETRAQIAAQAIAYRRLGALPDSADLRAILGRLLGEQVAGYYDPESKTLYVVQGVDSATAAVTLRHEMVHALQDQHRDLDSLLHLPGDADRAAAAQAALEGQATWTQVGGGTDLASRFPGGWERVRAQIRENASRSPELADAPLVVREGLLFPYLSGAELARAVALAGHPDSLVRRLPPSTEQVLHAERYLRDERPLTVTLPAPRAGRVMAENTLGEFDTRLVLYGQLEDLDRAARAAVGWGGDRWAAVQTPGGEAFVWLTVWDTPVDAAEFLEAMAEFVPRRYPGAAPAPAAAPPRGAPNARGRAGAAGAPADSGGAREFAVPGAPGGARHILLRAAAVSGRPAVLYVDAPAGAGTDLLDLARATARP